MNKLSGLCAGIRGLVRIRFLEQPLIKKMIKSPAADGDSHNEGARVFCAFCVICTQNDQVFDRESVGFLDSHKSTNDRLMEKHRGARIQEAPTRLENAGRRRIPEIREKPKKMLASRLCGMLE